MIEFVSRWVMQMDARSYSVSLYSQFPLFRFFRRNCFSHTLSAAWRSLLDHASESTVFMHTQFSAFNNSRGNLMSSNIQSVSVSNVSATTNSNTASSPALQIGVKQKLLPSLLAFAIGCTILFAMGFSASPSLHNAAHDGRHSAGFPCH